MSKVPTPIRFHIIFICFLTILGGLLISENIFASSSDGLKIVNPTHGSAKINGETASYYYFKTKITAERKSDLVFREHDCMLIDKNGTTYSKCWIYTSDWSAGLSMSQQAPILMKTLSLELSGRETSKSHKWNTSMVDGPYGTLEFSIPEGGFVELHFLWEVKKSFSASKVKIGDIIEISF